MKLCYAGNVVERRMWTGCGSGMRWCGGDGKWGWCGGGELGSRVVGWAIKERSKQQAAPENMKQFFFFL